MKKLYKKIKNKIIFFVYKNKKFKTEEAFYTYLFTKNPSWSSPLPNEDESIRWEEIKSEFEKLNITKKNLALLEIGCGRGWMCKKLSQYGSIIGIDPIEPVIKYAKKLFPNIEFYTHTPITYQKQFPSKKFDAVFTTEVLEHVTNKEEFIQNINDLLHQKGILILTTPRLEHYSDFKEFFGIDPNQPLEDWISEEQAQSLFEKKGFRIINKKFISPLVTKTKTTLMTQLWVCEKL